MKRKQKLQQLLFFVCVFNILLSHFLTDISYSTDKVTVCPKGAFFSKVFPQTIRIDLPDMIRSITFQIPYQIRK